MKEKMLVLAKAYPEYSKNHGWVMCTAGITESGEWRRVYPIEMDIYIKGKFSKRNWIEYEIKEKDGWDIRKESKRVITSTIKVVGNEDVESVRMMLKEKLTTLEQLKADYSEDKTSIGVIKPKLNDFRLKPREWDERVKQSIETQTTLTETFKADLLDKRPQYDFMCGNQECGSHSIICEDMEAMMLYKRMKNGHSDEDLIYDKVKNKLFDWMKTRDLYFIMGSHFLYPTFLIISLFYPKYYGESLEKFFK